MSQRIIRDFAVETNFIVKSILAAEANLPPSPAVGDCYYCTSEKSICLCIAVTPTWQKRILNSAHEGLLVNDQDTNLTYWFNGSALVELIDLSEILAAADAMLFKGTIGAGGTHTIAQFNGLTTYDAGWTYRVIEAGTIRGNVCEIGDLVMVIVDRTGSGNQNSDFTVAQANIDGVVIGPASAADNRVAVFDGVSGKLIKDGGKVVADFELVANKKTTLADNSDTFYPSQKAVKTAVDLKAPLESPAFTGTPTGITKTHVGLSNVDNTSDANKPVSTAQQTALNLKQNVTTYVANVGVLICPDNDC